MPTAQQHERSGLMSCPHCKTGQVFLQQGYLQELYCLQCGWRGEPQIGQVEEKRATATGSH